MSGGRERVWLADPQQGFILATIVELAEEGPVLQPVDRYCTAQYWYCTAAQVGKQFSGHIVLEVQCAVTTTYVSSTKHLSLLPEELWVASRR
jgi:hypothetical protein